jgi:hypothetical protein
VERIGTLGDGGKWVCGIDRVAKQDKCVIYSFGGFFFFAYGSMCSNFPSPRPSDRYQRRVVV